MSAMRAGRASLRKLGGTGDEPAQPDPRSAELARSGAVHDGAVVASLAAVFEGTGLMEDRERSALVMSVRNEVHAEWARTRRSFLAIGRALLAAEEALTAEQFRRLRQGSERLFPFSDTIASQLRTVARSVRDGRIAEEACPGSYSVAYQIAMLDDAGMRAAEARNLVRPDVTRGEVVTFRRERAQADAPSDAAAMVPTLPGRRMLLLRKAALQKELNDVMRMLRMTEGRDSRRGSGREEHEVPH